MSLKDLSILIFLKENLIAFIISYLRIYYNKSILYYSTYLILRYNILYLFLKVLIS